MARVSVDAAPRGEWQNYRDHFACFDCRKAFKWQWDETDPLQSTKIAGGGAMLVRTQRLRNTEVR